MKEILLTYGWSALVDDKWFARLNRQSWRAKESRSGVYAVGHLKVYRGYYFSVRMHRLILGLLPRKTCPYAFECNCSCEDSDVWEVHHANEDKLDNREENLIKMGNEEHHNLTKSGGSIFRPKPLRPASRFIGVRWNLERGKWQAGWRSGTGEYIVGFYPDDVSAAIAYDYSARKLLGPGVRTNFPVGGGDIPF